MDTTSKLKLGLGITAFVIAIILLALTIFWFVGATNQKIIKLMTDFIEMMGTTGQDSPVGLCNLFGILSVIGVFIFGIISNRFIASFRKDGYSDNKGITALYVISFIPTGIVGVLILIVIGIIWIYNKICDANAQTSYSSSSSYKRTVNVRDHVGYDRKLEYDNNTETWRDSLGNHYTTKDDGKTFTKK